MALIKCIECGHEVSDKASMCPKCGCPVEFNEEDTPKVSENVKSNIIITNDSKASTMVPSSSKSTKVFWKNKNHLTFLVLSIIAVAVITFLIYTSLSSTNTQEMMEPVAEAEVEERGIDLQKPFTTKKVEYQKETSEVDVSIIIDYPSQGPTFLVNNIRRYIENELCYNFCWDDNIKPQYDGDIKDGQAFTNYMGQFILKELSKQHEDAPYPFYASITIKNKHETNKYLTYEICRIVNYGGTSMIGFRGDSFNKADGGIIDIIKNSNDDGLKKLMISAVKKHEDANQFWLDSDFYNDPVPPESYLFNGEVVFVFPPYQIGPGCLGAVEITIDKKDILPYLTDEAKELLEDEVKTGVGTI